ncbi:hypothetical protein EDC01DRAFT_47319 [Geopyxis carbonaria]|nr:hypothetical protein EDC01DRAFT_47319 [Geopyxis carbonaria]
MYGNCKDKQKIYYRLDNFRNHLKKLHPPRDASAIQLEQFIKRAENDCRYEDPLPMDVNQDTASETASVATSMMPTDALGKATIQSDAESVHTVSTPGRASFPQDGSGFTPKKRKQAELVHPPSYRPWTKTMLNAAEQERSSNSMDIDSDPPSERNWKRHESSTARQLAPPPIPKVDMEKAAKEKERLRKIMVLKDQILKLQGEVQTLEKEGVENASLIGFQPGRDSVGTSIMPHEHGSQENRPPLSQQALVGCPAGNVAIARFVAQDPKDDPTPFVNPGSANGEKSQVSPMEMDQSPTRPEMDRTGFGSRTGVLSPPETVASPAADHRNGSTGFHPMEETIRTPGPASPSTSFVPPIQAQPERGARPGAFANREAKGFPCDHPGCKSKFHRESELRKHKKRHTRPYGCTYRHCGKTFGSKNDWKRHENSQHHKLESWKCQMTLKAGDKCGKLCYRKENFINHLKSSAHNLKDRSLLESETENSYIGGPGHHTFWCGFCIDPSGKRGHNVRLKGGLAGWDERFDHLAQHFETGSNIKSFNHPDDDGGYTDCSTLSEPEDDDLPETLSPLNKLADLAASKLPIARHIQSSPQHMDAPERLQKRIPSASGPSMGLSGDQAAKVWFCCRQHPAGGLPHPQLIDLAPSCFTCEHARCGRCSVVDAAPEK